MKPSNDNAFLAAMEQFPREKYPAANLVDSIFRRLDLLVLIKFPPHLHPLFVRLRAFCVRKTLMLEKRLRLNPAYRLMLSIRIIPPEGAFIVAAASTLYVIRYLYKNALDLLTNLIAVAYPAYQSILSIEYGDVQPKATKCDELGIPAPNLDKKQWLMYWAIYGILNTADHWTGSILKLFPMYKLAKLAVLMWAQHSRYNGATWIYDTFLRPILPPPTKGTAHRSSVVDWIAEFELVKDNEPVVDDAKVDEYVEEQFLCDRNDSADEHATQRDTSEGQAESCVKSPKRNSQYNSVSQPSFSSLIMPSVWESPPPAQPSDCAPASEFQPKRNSNMLIAGPTRG